MEDCIDQFVSGYRLHQTCPVSLSAVQDLYCIRQIDLSPAVLGFAFAHHGRGLIGVNANLSLPEQRMVIAHECAHLLCDDPNSLQLCRVNAWLYQRYELMAQQSAARMLICRSRLLAALAEDATMGELCEVFAVPGVLVELRLRQLTAT